MLPDEPPTAFEDASLASDAPILPSLARAQRRARFVPDLTVRFTYLSGTSTPWWLYDSPADAWRSPFFLGATLEVRIVWGLDGWLTPPIATSGYGWGSP